MTIDERLKKLREQENETDDPIQRRLDALRQPNREETPAAQGNQANLLPAPAEAPEQSATEQAYKLKKTGWDYVGERQRDLADAYRAQPGVARAALGGALEGVQNAANAAWYFLQDLAKQGLAQQAASDAALSGLLESAGYDGFSAEEQAKISKEANDAGTRTLTRFADDYNAQLQKDTENANAFQKAAMNAGRFAGRLGIDLIPGMRYLTIPGEARKSALEDYQSQRATAATFGFETSRTPAQEEADAALRGYAALGGVFLGNEVAKAVGNAGLKLLRGMNKASNGIPFSTGAETIGLQNKILPNILLGGASGVAYSLGETGTEELYKAISNEDYTPDWNQIGTRAATAFAFGAISSAIRTWRVSEQNKMRMAEMNEAMRASYEQWQNATTPEAKAKFAANTMSNAAVLRNELNNLHVPGADQQVRDAANFYWNIEQEMMAYANAYNAANADASGLGAGGEMLVQNATAGIVPVQATQAPSPAGQTPNVLATAAAVDAARMPTVPELPAPTQEMDQAQTAQSAETAEAKNAGTTAPQQTRQPDAARQAERAAMTETERQKADTQALLDRLSDVNYQREVLRRGDIPALMQNRQMIKILQERMATLDENQESIRLTDADQEEYLAIGDRRHVRDQKTRQAEETGSAILTTPAQIANYIRDSIAGKIVDSIKGYGRVNNRLTRAVSTATNGETDISGYYLELNSNQLAHLSDHINQDKDARSIPLTPEQAEHIPEYIDNYDDLIDVIRRKDGSVRLMLGKKINGHTIIIEAVSKGRKSLHPVSAYQIDTEKYNRDYKTRAIDRSSTSRPANADTVDISRPAIAPVAPTVAQNAPVVNQSGALANQTEQVYNDSAKEGTLDGERKGTGNTGGRGRNLGDGEGSIRNQSERATERAGGVDRAAEANREGNTYGRDASQAPGYQVASRSAKDKGAVNLRYTKETFSAEDFGLPDADTSERVRVVESGETDHTRNAIAIAGDSDVILFGGGYLSAAGNDSIESVMINSTNTMLIAADDPNFTADRFAGHERCHRLIRTGSVDVRSAIEYAKSILPSGFFDDAKTIYRVLYPENTEEKNLVELVCDAAGNMNRPRAYGWENVDDYVARLDEVLATIHDYLNDETDNAFILVPTLHSEEAIKIERGDGERTAQNSRPPNSATDYSESPPSKSYAESINAREKLGNAMIDAMEAGDIGDSVDYSYRSLADAAGFKAVEVNGARGFARKDGKQVKKVTADDIRQSSIGALIKFAQDEGFLGATPDENRTNADKQVQFFAEVCTLAAKNNDFAMSMQFVGAETFTAIKSNSDTQYGTTYDFKSVCIKTQACIDSMSAAMVAKKGGLTKEEILDLYRTVNEIGLPVPCPECYVWNRWVGIGGLLDNMWKYQERYGAMSFDEVKAAYEKMHARVATKAEEAGLSFGKAKTKLSQQITKEYQKQLDKVEKTINRGDLVSKADEDKLQALESTMTDVKSLTWIETVYFGGKPMTAENVSKTYRVPAEILFDLNRGAEFATQYKDAWAFRTTQGAGYGKAITPYSEAALGEGILGTNSISKTVKDKAAGKLNNPFLDNNGELSDDAKRKLRNAARKQKVQLFRGGQRFNSTSDAGNDVASDYLLAMLEMQSMHGGVQVYTKVDGSVQYLSNVGAFINQSLMPLGSGLDENGNIRDTTVGGMSPKAAFANRKKYENAGTITIGVNDQHIRALYRDPQRDFVIPYHISGGDAVVVAEMRSIQDPQAGSAAKVRSSDYTRTQNEKLLSDVVLKSLGKDDAEIGQIKKNREARIAILTRGKPDMNVVRANPILSKLYDMFNGGIWDSVKLPKSEIEAHIYPNEFWDTDADYEHSGINTELYLQYCDDLGMLHKFSGKVPSNGKLVPVKGYDNHGNRVNLEDTAYVYKNGEATDEIEDYYWKSLVDHRMYGNNGQYLPQTAINLSNLGADVVREFAKKNSGRVYDKALSDKAAKVVREKFTQDEDQIDFSLRPVNPVQPSSELWKRSSTFAEVKAEHPTLYDLAADENEVRNPTQVTVTKSTYRKIYNILKDEGFTGTILDASSGLGAGTEVGRSEFGFNVEDIEPYPDKSYKPMYMDYSALNKTYDAIISNAVLNVLPQDLRDDLTVKMGEMLKPGGQMFVNVRGNDVLNAKSKVAIDADQMEYFIEDGASYQKGFTPKELKAYLEDALGDNFAVQLTTKFGKVSAIVTRNEAQANVDDAYLAAVNRGDMETAQRMVDEAAKAAGAITLGNGKPKPYYHGHGSGTKYTVFDINKAEDGTFGYGFYFSPMRSKAEGYGDVGTYFLMTDKIATRDDHNITPEQIRQIRAEYGLKVDNVDAEQLSQWVAGANDLRIILSLESAITRNTDVPPAEFLQRFRNVFGYDGIRQTNETILWDNKLIKSADPVTYDDNGNIIPLSQRFNTEEQDIRYSTAPNLARLEQENRRLRERLEEAKAQTKATRGFKARPEDVKRVASDLIESTDSKIAPSFVERAIQNLVESAAKGDVTTDEIEASATELAKNIINLSAPLVSKDETAYNHAKSYLKNVYIKVPDALRAQFRDFDAFAKASPDLQMRKDGVDVYVAYEALQKELGTDFFPRGLGTEKDMLEHMSETLESLKPVMENQYSFGMAVVTQELSQDILNSVLDIRQSKPTIVDTEREKTATAKAENRETVKKLKAAESYIREIQRTATRRAEQMQALKEHYAETKKRQSERKAERELRQRLLKHLRRLNNAKLPALTRAEVERIGADLDTIAVSITDDKTVEAKNLYEYLLNKTVEGKNPELYDPDFVVDSRTLRTAERWAKTQISQLTITDVKERLQALLNIEARLAAEKMFVNSSMDMMFEHAAQRVMDDLAATRPGSISSLLRPTTAALRITYNERSPLTIAMREMVKGEENADLYKREATKPFLPFMSNKTFWTESFGPKAKTIKITGVDAQTGTETTVEITPMMRVSLYMHSLNDDNYRHIYKGGIVVPDMESYRKGKLTEAYNKGKTIKLSRTLLQRIAEQMTQEEREFAKRLRWYYDEYAPERMNKTSVALDGYEKFLLENYYPITVDRNFLHADFESMVSQGDASLARPGFGEERQHSPKPIVLYDANSLLFDMINRNAAYACQAIPLHNMSRLLNMEFDKAGRSVKKSMNEAFSDGSAEEYLNNFMHDYGGHKRAKKSKLDKYGSTVDKIRNNYAGGVLTLAASTAFVQFASYPTAAITLSHSALTKAFAPVKIDLSYIDQKTAVFTKRTEGFISQEMADLKEHGVHIPKALNWIQAVDTFTTSLLKRAAYFYTREQNPTLDTDSAEFHNKVVDNYIRTVEQTQPNYSVALRPELQRTPDALTRSLVMFVTQPLQQYNLMYEAGIKLDMAQRADRINSTPQTQKAVKDARKGMAKAAAVIIESSLLFALLKLAASAIMGKYKKRYGPQDEDDDPVWAFIRRFGGDMRSAITGMVPMLNSAITLAEATIDKALKNAGKKPIFYTRWYGLEVSAVSAITDAFQDSSDALAALAAADDREGIVKAAKKTIKAAEDWALLFGIPAQKAHEDLAAIAGWFGATEDELWELLEG